MSAYIQETVTKMISDRRSTGETPLVVTHRNCMDGTGSVLAVALALHIDYKDLEVMWMQYGDEATELISKSRDRHVIITDVSFIPEVMTAIENVSKSIILIDHHKTSMELYMDKYYACIYKNYSGAGLTYRALCAYRDDKEIDDVAVPILLEYIEDHDLYNHTLKHSVEIAAALELYSKDDLEAIESHMHDVDALMEAGKVVSKYKDREATNFVDTILSKLDKPGSMKTLDGYKVPIINDKVFRNEVGEKIGMIYPFGIMFVVAGDKFIFSLRANVANPDHADVEVIAKKFGGGGHAEAAAFAVKSSDLDMDAFFNAHIIRIKDESDK